MYGDVTGTTAGTLVTADGTWQTAKCSKTWAADTVRRIYLCAHTDALAGEIIYWDAIQLEVGGVQTPYCVDVNDDAVTRTACTMSIPTATIGLTAGQDITVMAVISPVWSTPTGVDNSIFHAQDASATNRLRLYHEIDTLYWEVGNKYAIKAATMVGGSTHIAIATRTGGTIQVFFDGVAGAAVTGGTAEISLNANTYIGTTTGGGWWFNGAILCAIWGRVLSAAEITAISAWTLWTSATTCGPAIGSTYFDDVNDRFYVYTSAGWKYAALT